MDKFASPARTWLRRCALLPALLLFWIAGAAVAQEQDPPGRVASLTHAEGSLVYAPDGEEEWMELPRNRPLTRGDRLWTDRGSRAELHLGTAALHLDGESHLAFYELDDQAAQLSLTQGSVHARVRELAPRENFEIDTPNLALRATQPGAYRVDVDVPAGTTRVVVRSGEVMVYGERGESMRLVAGQQAVFGGRELAQVGGYATAPDAFDQWAMERNQLEDASITARHIPRGVVGYHQLDTYGSWSHDPGYGAVWYPTVTLANWAPYRYGHWAYVRPWGWTWVDDAPWGFAPFHYGRWALIGSRWAWVPGRLSARPIYSPALVAFVGGSGVNVSISIGSGPGIGWYPLAPGEAWWPVYRTSSVYITNINYNIVLNRHAHHRHRDRAEAWTALRMEDFHRGRPVRDHWKPVRPRDVAQAPLMQSLPRPERDRSWERDRRDRTPRLQAAPPAAVLPAVPSRNFPGAWGAGRGRDDARDVRREAREQDRPQRHEFVRQQQDQARREQERQQREAQRQANDNFVRQQQEQARREQERQQREAQRQANDNFVRQQQERAQRAAQQHDGFVIEQQRALREQQRAQQEQLRLQREAERDARMQMERAPRGRPESPRQQALPIGAPPQAQPQVQVPPQAGGRQGWERGGRGQAPQAEPQGAQQERQGRGEGRWQRGDDDRPRGGGRFGRDG